MMNSLSQLRQHTHLVADSALDVELAPFIPLFGVTTNPSLVIQALDQQAYLELVQLAAERCKAIADDKASYASLACDWLLAEIGAELHRQFGVQVSLEVDARLAYDTDATIERATQLHEYCLELDIPHDKLLIKIAATAEGLEAVRQLQSHSINCNVTLVFSIEQAAVAASCGAWLISPFVGRIGDWVKRHGTMPKDGSCPGVALVRVCQSLMHERKYSTLVMGASFRRKEQILQLCGTHLLTISPKLMRDLTASQQPAIACPLPPVPRVRTSLDTLKQQIEQQPMVSQLLQNGIARFVADQKRLEKLMLAQWQA